MVSHCYTIQFIAPPEIRDAEEKEEKEWESARIWRQSIRQQQEQECRTASFVTVACVVLVVPLRLTGRPIYILIKICLNSPCTGSTALLALIAV